MADEPPSSSPPEDTEEEDEDAKTCQDGDSSEERNANGRESVSIAEMEAWLTVW